MDSEQLNKLLISRDKTVKQAMQQIGPASAGILFVVDKEHTLLGTITDGDIRRGLLKGVNFDDNLDAVTYKDFVYIENDIHEFNKAVKQLMKETRNEQIPVLDSKGRIIDVVLLIDTLGEDEVKTPKAFASNQVVIMAGGVGSRLDPFTKILPKPLIPIGDLPVIEVIMNSFYRYGINRFTYTLNYKKEYIKLYLSENCYKYKIDWVEEPEFLGTAGSLSLLKKKLTKSFFVTNCDSLLDVDYSKILRWHARQNAKITIIGCHREYKIPFGVLQLADGKLEKFREKPVHDMIINTGVYVMEPGVLEHIPDGTSLDMNELIERVSAREKVSVYTVYNGWLDIGQWKEYKKNIDKIEGMGSQG